MIKKQKQLSPMQREAIIKRQAAAAKKKTIQVRELKMPSMIISREEAAARERARLAAHNAEMQSLRKKR